jgi:hypothetical protein
LQRGRLDTPAETPCRPTTAPAPGSSGTGAAGVDIVDDVRLTGLRRESRSKIAAQRPFALDRFEEGLKVAVAEAARACRSIT